MSRLIPRAALGVCAATALALTACSSTGGKQPTGEAGGSAGKANTPTMTVAFISHAAPGDTFWDQVRQGAEDAASKDNVALEYTADPDGANQANLVKTAVDKKVDGIAVTLAKPDAVQANVERALADGIPVVALNGGIDVYKEMGVLGYFGQDETVAGEAAGTRLTEDGAGKTLCVIHEQGNVSVEARCAGVAKTHPDTEKVYVTGTDMPNVQSTIASKLQEDPKITHVLTLGAPFALTAVQAVETAGSKATVVTFDLNAAVITAIKDGKVAWAVDQQPYLQGYLGVDSLWLYKNKGITIGGGRPVFTGPAFVDESNVDKVAETSGQG